MMKNVRSLVAKYGPRIAVPGTALVLAGAARADDPALAAIATAQTTAMAVASAVTGLAIAVWGALYVKNKFFGK